MALDPRLADLQLLALAALRLKQREPPFRWLAWGAPVELDEARQPPGITVPEKAPSVEAWAQAMQVRFGSLMEQGPESHGL